ncbi:MAG: DUF2815 family protein [Deltaproteobacteria bacterium]|nr:MAG: DUF2815 family protein [Deltaproteobacteria bacterium]
MKLKNVRISFCQNLFVPGKMKNAKPEDKAKYSATFLIPKNDPQLKDIQAEIERVAALEWRDKAPAILKGLMAENRVCLHDGDTKPDYDGYEGNMYIRASSNDENRDGTKRAPPVVIDADKTILTVKSGKPYAGCYVNCAITIKAQNNEWGKRINAYLNVVQFLRDGDAFMSGVETEDDFDDVSNIGADDLA